MREYEYYQVDVFTSEPFCGNPLAVVPDAEGLTPQEMMMVAREMCLPETTFVFPSQLQEALYRMRIFTPTIELPFTGHPAIGAHWVMAELGKMELSEPVTTIVYEQGVGLLNADFHVKDGRVDHIMMDHCPPVIVGELHNIRDLASGLGITPEDITRTNLPVQAISTGFPSLIVPIRSLATVQRLDPVDMHLTLLSRTLNHIGASFMLVFTTETVDPDVDVHVRGFGHMVGIPEDPVTGSSNGALGAYLVRNGVIPATGSTVRFISEQGIEMKRPGTMVVEVDHDDGKPTAVRVGGQVVQTMKGVIRF